MTRVEAGDSRSNWDTASFGLPAETSPVELSALGEHLDSCRLGARASTLQCAAQAVQGFVAARLVTSVAAVALVALLAWLLL